MQLLVKNLHIFKSMNWFKKIYEVIKEKSGKRSRAQPLDSNVADAFSNISKGIHFGRYSDNNKTYRKAQCWYTAEELFKEKKYTESITAFFEYLKDEQEDNVHFYSQGEDFTFDILQGAKKIEGSGNGKTIKARTSLAIMEQQELAVMRRLLDMNFNLQYTRNALDDNNNLCMIFDSDTSTASPEKLYYSLRELATKADKVDDLLLADFSGLKTGEQQYTEPLPPAELEMKYYYFQSWINDMLALTGKQNQDAFSGAIAYMLAAVVYRIDFLISPHARMQAGLEKISATYWERKDEITLVERNQLMFDALKKINEISTTDFAKSVYRTHSTFAIATPAKAEKIKDNIYNANKDAKWYIDNLQPEIAVIIIEYGVMYNHFIYSMPAVLTSLATLFMAALHPGYFTACGIKEALYNPADNTFRQDEIEYAADMALEPYKDKFNKMKWDHSRIKYTSLTDFCVTFSEQMANLNLETKR